MTTGTVGAAPCDGAVATVPTANTTPGVVFLSGNVIVTWSPTFTCDCWFALRFTLTMRVVDLEEHLALVDDLPGGGQRGDRALHLAQHVVAACVAEGAVHIRPRRQILLLHRRQSRLRGVRRCGSFVERIDRDRDDERDHDD